MDEIKKYSAEDVVVYLVGTKADVRDRAVTIQEGQAAAAKLGVKYYEVSSKTGENVDALFCKIVNDLKIVSYKRTASHTPMSSTHDEQQSRAAVSSKEDGDRKCCLIL